MTETNSEQLLRFDQYLLVGTFKDFSRKLYELSGDTLKEVQSSADLSFGDLAIKHGQLYAIVDSRRLLVSDLRSGKRIHDIIVPFDEELEGIHLCGDGVFVWTSSEFYLLDETGDDHVKVGEFRCPIEHIAVETPESSGTLAKSDSQPTNETTCRGLWTATVVRYDSEQNEFEAIIHYDGREGEWRLLCKDGRQISHEMIADDPWELVGVRNDTIWLLKSREDERRLIARRNGEIVHEVNYTRMAALWQGVINDDGLLYLRYCDSERNDFVDVIDITEDDVNRLRTFSLGCEPGCTFFIPVINKMSIPSERLDN